MRTSFSLLAYALTAISLIATQQVLGEEPVCGDLHCEEPESWDTCNHDCRVPTQEYDALLTFYAATAGTEWYNDAGWLDGHGTECSWAGVFCSAPADDPADVHVIKLDFEAPNNLSGSIPAEIADLAELQVLRPVGNHLQDPLPSELTLINSLTVLDLRENEIAGEIPPWIGSIPSLEGLSLMANDLTGTIPTELGQLTNLVDLSIDQNHLTGEIPQSLESLSMLRHFNMSHNLLEGSVPSWLGDLSELYEIRLSGNNLTGSIPTTLGQLAGLEWLHLDNNDLTGPIPTELASLTNLRFLTLQANRLEGGLPAAFGQLASLEELMVQDNRLDSAVPPEIGNMPSLRALHIARNAIVGRLPGTLLNLPLDDNASDFTYNGLYVDPEEDDALRTFLNSKQIDGDWEGTQTKAPANPRARQVSRTEVEVTWDLILYTEDTGGYWVHYGLDPEDLDSIHPIRTATKTHGSLTVSDLDPDLVYFFAVQAETEPHAGNQNAVLSELGDVVSAVGIDSIEITQAIQIWQPLEEFKASPNPVPLIAGRPAVMRVYMREAQVGTVLRLSLSVPLLGVSEDVDALLNPSCNPTQQRYGGPSATCRSANFDLPTLQPGDFEAHLELFEKDGSLLESHDLLLSATETEELVVKGVRVCYEKLPDGSWRCNDDELQKLEKVLRTARQATPASKLNYSRWSTDVYLPILWNVRNCDFVLGDPRTWTLTRSDWFCSILREVEVLGLFDSEFPLFASSSPPIRYIAPIDVSLKPPWGEPGDGDVGEADDIPGRIAWALVRNVPIWDEGLFAHEIFHTLGRMHTNSDLPTGKSCSALDVDTDWPWATNYLESPSSIEAAFDIERGQSYEWMETFSIMSYCNGQQWSAPFTFLRLLDDYFLPDDQSSDVRSQESMPALAEGDFWAVSGMFLDGGVSLEPIVEVHRSGPTDEGSGDHAIVVLDAADNELFVRFFTPQERAEIPEAPPAFSELVPVVAGAARLSVLDPQDAVLVDLSMGGTPPTVSITYPAGGETLTGLETVAWNVTDPDSSEHSFWVQYSAVPAEPDTWMNVARTLNEASAVVDFDLVPGAASTAVVRVFASDGVNTGVAVSNVVSVPEKNPVAEILFPEDGHIFRNGQVVWLQSSAHDLEDRDLTPEQIEWESSLDGPIGVGAELPTTMLGAGLHEISVTVTDTDGGTAADMVTIAVAGPPPIVRLEVLPVDTDCQEATVNAIPQPGSVGLASAAYSLDDGRSWIPIPLAALPHRFVVPGQGSVLLAAMAMDEAGQTAPAAQEVTLPQACDLTPGTRTLSVGVAGNGEGLVNSEPSGIDCGLECTAEFVVDAIVVLNANASGGSRFMGWGGDPDCLDGIVTMSADRACHAAIDVCESTPDLHLENETVSEHRIFDACEAITTGEDLHITATGDVELYAGKEIAFGDGFSIDSGGKLQAVLGPPPD